MAEHWSRKPGVGSSNLPQGYYEAVNVPFFQKLTVFRYHWGMLTIMQPNKLYPILRKKLWDTYIVFLQFLFFFYEFPQGDKFRKRLLQWNCSPLNIHRLRKSWRNCSIFSILSIVHSRLTFWEWVKRFFTRLFLAIQGAYTLKVFKGCGFKCKPLSSETFLWCCLLRCTRCF